jgi:hypothetical protein
MGHYSGLSIGGSGSFVIFLYAYIILYVFFLPVDEEPEQSRSDWCEEYHSDLTYGECSNVAGW